LVVGFKGRAIGAEKVVADRCGVEDGEGRERVFVEAKGLVAFEFLALFPSRGLKKMLVHRDSIA